MYPWVCCVSSWRIGLMAGLLAGLLAGCSSLQACCGSGYVDVDVDGDGDGWGSGERGLVLAGEGDATSGRVGVFGSSQWRTTFNFRVGGWRRNWR